MNNLRLANVACHMLIHNFLGKLVKFLNIIHVLYNYTSFHILLARPTPQVNEVGWTSDIETHPVILQSDFWQETEYA
jgi:hypothetical protein